MKETYYFSHDYNARQDDKIKPLLAKHGMVGYGIYWAIIEDLYTNSNVMRTHYDSIAYALHTNVELVQSVVEDFDLFVIDDGKFGSMSVQRRLDERAGKSKKAQMSAEKRWNKEKSNANALRTHSDRNAIKESKVKESKVNTYTPFLKKFNEITKRQFKILDKKTISQLKAREKQGFKLEDIYTATRHAYADQFHKETNHRYLTPEFITREDKLQRFLHQKPKKEGKILYN